MTPNQFKALDKGDKVQHVRTDEIFTVAAPYCNYGVPSLDPKGRAVRLHDPDAFDLLELAVKEGV